MSKIDKTDLEIVGLLMEDGRMPAAEIARRVGDISERVVRYRIGRMVSEGLIKIGAIANPRKFGRSVVADVVLEVEAGKINEVAQALVEFEQVSYVAFSIGENDVSFQIVARDTQDVYRFVTEVVGQMPGVRKTATTIVPQVLKDVYQWKIPESAIQEIEDSE